MNIDEDKKITIYDSKGNERDTEVVFTYENEERGTKYVFFWDPDDEENIIVMKYNDQNELEEIDDDEEFEEVQEVYNAYMEDPKIIEAKK